jgi:tetratricopeptide (TPR) repeat protein
MARWLAILLIVVLLAGLALSAAWWLPWYLATVMDDTDAIQQTTVAVQLLLWILAGLVGFLGIRYALRAGRDSRAVARARPRKAAARDTAAPGVDAAPETDGIEEQQVTAPAEEREPEELVDRAPVAGVEDAASTGAAMAEGVGGNLPAAPHVFVGREEEATEVGRRLLGDQPFATIVGMGGVGKTALALQVAQQLVGEGRFPDAQLYVDLKGSDCQPLTPAAALNALLDALVGARPGRPGDEEALAYLWHAAMQDRDALLVLDDADGAAQVSPLLAGSPTCAVLITSRQRFSLDGFTSLVLKPMQPPEAQALLGTLAPELDDAQTEKIAELCDGLPLALQIVGSSLAADSSLPPDEYTALLADETGRIAQLRDPEDPDRGVAASLSAGAAGLTAGSREAWALLGLLPAPFELAAAAAVWGDGVTPGAWDPLDDEMAGERLRDLQARSLVDCDPRTGCYAQHSLQRLVALQELEGAPGVEGARRRLAFHFMAVTQALSKGQRFRDLDPAWPHLKAALEYAAASPKITGPGTTGDTELLSNLVQVLDDYWSVRGMARERAFWCQQAAEACAAAHLRREEGRHLGSLGLSCAELGDPQQAIDYHQQALSIAREVGDRQAAGIQLGRLGSAHDDQGDSQRAIDYYEEALALAQAVGDRRSEGIHVGNTGEAYAHLGNTERAIDQYELALDIAQEIGDRRDMAAWLGRLGQTYADLGEMQPAIEFDEQALAIAREVGHRQGEATHLGDLGRAYAGLGETQQAIDCLLQAIEISQQIEDRRGEGLHLGSLGRAYADLGENQRAIEVCSQALAISRETQDRRAEGIHLDTLGRTYRVLGDDRRASAYYEQAVAVAREIGDQRSAAARLDSLGRAYAAQGRVQKAMDTHEQALQIARDLGDRSAEQSALAEMDALAPHL